MLEELDRDGYFLMGTYPLIAENLVKTVKAGPAYTGHVIPQGDRVERTFEDAIAQPHGFACHPMSLVLSTPGLFAHIASLQTSAASYFGEEPVLYSVNAMWKKPNGAPGWHYDEDDVQQMVMFMYGTHVSGMGDGVHQYITGSHKWSKAKKKPHHNVEVEVSGPIPADWPIHNFFGSAGTTFITDTRGLHNGLNPAKDPRLLLWARWGVTAPPQVYLNDEISPVPWRQVVSEKPDETTQRRTRLVVDWS